MWFVNGQIGLSLIVTIAVGYFDRISSLTHGMHIAVSAILFTTRVFCAERPARFPPGLGAGALGTLMVGPHALFLLAAAAGGRLTCSWGLAADARRSAAVDVIAARAGTALTGSFRSYTSDSVCWSPIAVATIDKEQLDETTLRQVPQLSVSFRAVLISIFRSRHALILSTAMDVVDQALLTRAPAINLAIHSFSEGCVPYWQCILTSVW